MIRLAVEKPDRQYYRTPNNKPYKSMHDCLGRWNRAVYIIAILQALAMPHVHSQSYNGPGTKQDVALVDKLNEKARYFQTQDSDSALYYSRKAVDIAKNLKYIPGQATGALNAGIYYQSKGQLPSAMENDLKAIELLENQDSDTKGTAYLALAQVYKDMSGDNTKDYINKSIGYAKTAYEIYTKLKDTLGMANSLSMQGILYRDRAKLYQKPGYYDTAFVAFSTAIRLSKLTGKDDKNIAKFYNNISQVYYEYKKDYNKALEYLYMAVKENQNHHYLLGLTHNYGNISDIYRRSKQYDKALEYAKKMLETSQQIKRPSRIYFSYKNLYYVYNDMGRSDSALQYYILTSTLNDSLTDIKRTQQVLDLQYKYETAKKELEILNLHKAEVLNRNRIVLLIAALLVTGAIALGFIWLYRRVQHQKVELDQQSKKLEVMMKELHHRVKNNLQIVTSLLSLQAYKLSDDKAISVLQESQQRVQAMSLIHQRLYKQDEFTKINIREYVSELVNSLMSSFGYTPENFTLHLNVSKEILDIDQALPLGLILNEIITNAFKYAYADVDCPALFVSVTEDPKNILLSIRDNGKGLDHGDWKHKNDSFGKQLITALSKQLRAKQSIVVDQGTEFNLIIPKKAA